jgi:hypothetical protein
MEIASMFKINRVIGLVFVNLSLAMASEAAQAKPVKNAPISEDQLNVYRGFLDRFASLHIRNLARTTAPLDFAGIPHGNSCLIGLTLEGPSEAMGTVHAFGSEITKGRHLDLVDPVKQRALLEQQKTTSNQAKQDARVGNDLRFLIFSEIAFDTEHRHAILKYLVVCGEHCASGATLVMEKIDGHWTTSARRPCAMFVN